MCSLLIKYVHNDEVKFHSISYDDILYDPDVVIWA